MADLIKYNHNFTKNKSNYYILFKQLSHNEEKYLLCNDNVVISLWM